MWEWFEATPTPDLAQARSLLLIGAVGIGALILVLIATLFGAGRRPASRAPDDSPLRRLRRIALRDGIDADDAAVLEQLARHSEMVDPTRLLTDPRLCRDLLGRAIHAVEHRPDLTDHDRQHWLARYFQLEERMERRSAGDPRRRHRRRLAERPCIVTPVRIGPRRRVPALAPERRTIATIMDVSTGGCAVHSLGPFTADALARIEFDLDRHAPVVAIGRARHVRTQWPAGTIVHLQFTRLSREHRNRIHRFVYGHDRRSTSDRDLVSHV